MYGALDMVHDQPIVQHHLQQALQYLTQLDYHTTTLYLTHHKAIPKPHVVDFIPRTPTAWCIINNTGASWQRGIEQMVAIVK